MWLKLIAAMAAILWRGLEWWDNRQKEIEIKEKIAAELKEDTDAKEKQAADIHSLTIEQLRDLRQKRNSKDSNR